MLDVSSFALGSKDMETVLNEQGLSAGIYSKYADQARKNIRFLVMMNLMTEEEAQTVFNRIIAMIGRALK